MSVHITIVLKTKNITHLSQSKVLSKIYMIHNQGHSGSIGLLFSSCLPTSLNSTHISQLAGLWMLHELSSFLDLAFTVSEKCKEHYYYVSRLFLVQMTKLCGMKGSWCLCLRDVQQQERWCRIISNMHLPISNS